MAQLIVTATQDGRMDNNNAVWDTCHDAATGTSVDTTDLAAQTYYNGSDNYLIRRAVMTFDTSSIPAGATIDSATITLIGYTESTTYTMTSGIYGMAAYGTLGTSDFGSVTDTLQSDTKTTAQWNNAGSNVFTLNATGEGSIGIAGTTYFSFRSVDVDVADSAPGSGENKWQAARTSSTGGSEPTLTVNYTVPNKTLVVDTMAVVATFNAVVLKKAMTAVFDTMAVIATFNPITLTWQRGYTVVVDTMAVVATFGDTLFRRTYNAVFDTMAVVATFNPITFARRNVYSLAVATMSVIATFNNVILTRTGWNNRTKNSTSWIEDDKNSTSWTEDSKS